LWARLSARDPALFADASLDVQYADLGQQGIYWRVRAGAFADRANAEAFCSRVRTLGQDCIAVRR
jgi:cell division septation protein DedD